MAKKRSVLFVCMGNICRSPAGEAVMNKLAGDRGLGDRFDIDSAGTIAFHVGESADIRMREAAALRGYHIDSVARRVTKQDFDRFDLIVAMDLENLEDLQHLDREMRHRKKLRLLSDFLPADAAPDVPDPYYGGASGFQRVLDIMEEACETIIDHLLNGTQDKRQ